MGILNCYFGVTQLDLFLGVDLSHQSIKNHLLSRPYNLFGEDPYLIMTNLHLIAYGCYHKLNYIIDIGK